MDVQISPPNAKSRTEAARRMSLIHGLHSKYAVIPGEDSKEFEDFRTDYLFSLRPLGPAEAGAAEQLILAQWHLRRVTMIQTGVFEAFEASAPHVPGETYPMRLARCFAADCAATATLDKMSRHQVRLVNIFHKQARFLALSDEMREKQLYFRKGERRRKDEQYSLDYGLPEDWAPERDEWAVPDRSDTGSRENADRGEAIPQAVATPAPASPASPPEASPATGTAGDPPPSAARTATPSSESSSRKNADRGGSSGTNGKREFPVGTDATTPPEIVARLRELNAEYWRLRREANKQDWAEAS